jgi:hypothetical protein
MSETSSNELRELRFEDQTVAGDTNAMNRRKRLAILNQIWKGLVDGWLSTCEADFVDSMSGEDGNETSSFFKRHELISSGEADTIMRHAIDTAQVTFLCDAHAEIVMKPLKGIQKWRRRDRGRGPVS